MKIAFSISEKDYLNYLLFNASTSELVKKRRRRGKYLVPAIYLALAVIAFLIDNLVLSVILAVVAVLWIAFYPMIQRRQYFRYYQKHIRENFSEKCNIPVSLEFQEHFLYMKDADSELKIKTSEIKVITEVSEYFYIKMRTGSSIIIPKEQIDNLIELKNELHALAVRQNISFSEQLHWEWK